MRFFPMVGLNGEWHEGTVRDSTNENGKVLFQITFPDGDKEKLTKKQLEHWMKCFVDNSTNRKLPDQL